MMFDGDITALLEWEALGGSPLLGCSRLLAHPRFQAAARALAKNMLDICVDNGLRGIFKDAGRYVAAMWALYLHGAGELTLPALKRICLRSGLLSPGRARSVLLYLLHLRYIEPAKDQSRCGAVRYVPTASFHSAWASHLRAAVSAAAIIEPGAKHVLDALDRPEVIDTLNRIQSEGLLGASRASQQDSPYFRIFMHRHAGSQIAWMLMTSPHGATDFPPREPVSLPVASIARRFEISRVHVRRLFDDARAEGLIEADERGAICFTDGAGAFIRHIYAAQLVQLLASTAGTLRARPELHSQGVPT